MANIYESNPIVIDTFTSNIDFSTLMPEGMKLNSIEWSKPTNVAHLAQVKAGGSSGPDIFNEQCTTANGSIIKYFHGAWVKPIYIPKAASNLWASGSLIITLDKMEGKAPTLS
jgi:hypothetical protein